MKAGTRTGRLIVLMVLGALSARPGEVAAADTTTVSLKGTRFNPADVTVAPGDTVVWNNDDNTGHSVTFDDGSFDSHPSCTQGLLGPVNCMDPGETVQRKFNQPGDYPYTCKLHAPSMAGAVHVKVPEATATTVTTATTEPPTTVTTAATTTTTRKLATSSTLASTTTTTVPAETTTTLTPNDAPAFDPEGRDGDGEAGASPAGSGGGGGGSGTVALIVAVLLAVAGGGGVLLWRLRPRPAQP